MSFPVMMVHGMCCTGEVWHNFRTHFEARGATVFTPTLRPQERVRRGVPASLGELSLSDYLEELITEVARIEAELGQRPMLIGHSMGGLLAQLLAERNLVRAAVFISPAAPVGARDMSTRLMWAGVRVGGVLGLTPKVIRPGRRMLDRSVLNMADAEAAQRAHEGFVAESGRAFRDFATATVDESRVRIPVLTVSARRDRLVPARLTRLTGKKYESVGGEFVEYDEHGHWLYDEPGWERPAQDIFEWLQRHAASSGAAAPD